MQKLNMKTNWYIKTAKGKILGPISEAQCRKTLEKEDLTKIFVKQGDSVWRPAQQVLNLFLQLERDGFYIEQDGTIHGPFTEAKFQQMIPTCPFYANWRKGTKGPWNFLQAMQQGHGLYPTPAFINQNTPSFGSPPQAPNYMTQNQINSPTTTPRKSNIQSAPQSKRVLAGILGIFLGGLGIHRFVIGDTSGGIKRILLNLLCGAGGLIGLIEGILYLTKSDEYFIETYQIPETRKAWF
jgi:TM2 domain-containing membrane protein YozV